MGGGEGEEGAEDVECAEVMVEDSAIGGGVEEWGRGGGGELVSSALCVCVCVCMCDSVCAACVQR